MTSSWLRVPVARDHVPPVPVDAARRYEQDGFFICDQPLVPPDVVTGAVEGMDAIRAGSYDTGRPPYTSPWNPGDDPDALCKIELPQLASRPVRKLISHPAIGRWAAELTGARAVQVWWVQLLYKPPTARRGDDSTNVGWHQDRQYWGAWEDDSELLTAWVALSDVSAEAGPVIYLRGSHRWGERDEGAFKETDHAAQRRRIKLPENAVWEEVPAILPGGGVVFHTKTTLHASGPNHSHAPRRSFAIHMRTERARPKGGKREGLTQFIDDDSVCPVIFRRKGATFPE